MSGDLSDLPTICVFFCVLLLFLAAILNAAKFAISCTDDQDLQKNKLMKKKTISIISLKVSVSFIYSFSLFYIFYHSFFKLFSNKVFSYSALNIFIFFLLFSLLFIFVVSIFCEILPERLVSKNPDKFLYKVIGIVYIVVVLFKPIAYFVFNISKQIIKIFKLGAISESQIKDKAEEDILNMLEKGNEKGVIEEDVKDMVSGIFDFDDTIVGEIMTHRTEMTAIADDTDINKAIELAVESGFSRIPVYHEDVDNIVGVIYAKDLLRHVYHENKEVKNLNEITRPAVFIPKSKHLDELFAEMRQSKTQIAVIVDEYGGTEGLVTIEDLIEEILGNIQDEYDKEVDEAKKVNETTFTLDGNMNIYEACELLDVDIPEGDYETISGFIIEKLGYIPNIGEHPKLHVGDITFTVSTVENRRIAKVIAVKVCNKHI